MQRHKDLRLKRPLVLFVHLVFSVLSLCAVCLLLHSFYPHLPLFTFVLSPAFYSFPPSVSLCWRQSSKRRWTLYVLFLFQRLILNLKQVEWYMMSWGSVPVAPCSLLLSFLLLLLVIFHSWISSPSKPTSSRSPCFCLSCLLGDPSQEVIFSTELLSSLGHLYLPVLQEVNLLLQSFIHLKWLLWCQHTGPLGALAQPRCSANQGAAACSHSIRPCCTKQLFLPLKNILFALRLQLTQTSILIYSCAANIIALENS